MKEIEEIKSKIRLYKKEKCCKKLINDLILEIEYLKQIYIEV